MTVLVKQSSLRLLLKWTQRALLAGAALMLGYCGFVLLDAWMFQLHATQTLERPRADRPAPDGLIGRIEIQRLGMSVAVAEGTDDPRCGARSGTLQARRYPDSPATSASPRTATPFSGPCGTFAATTSSRSRRWAASTAIASCPPGSSSPRDVAVLNSDGDEILTLVLAIRSTLLAPLRTGSSSGPPESSKRPGVTRAVPVRMCAPYLAWHPDRAQRSSNPFPASGRRRRPRRRSRSSPESRRSWLRWSASKRDGSRVLKSRKRHLGRVDHAGFHQVLILAGRGVEAVVRSLLARTFSTTTAPSCRRCRRSGGWALRRRARRCSRRSVRRLPASAF